MAVVEPCSLSLQERRVELVDVWSQRISHLQEELYQMGALTEEDVSLVRGGGSLGERDRMRTLLDVLHGRGEEACRAFFHVLQRENTGITESEGVEADQPLDGKGQNNQNYLEVILRKHKEIAGKQHTPTDYLSLRGGGSKRGEAGCFTDITLSRRVGYAVPLQYQHETAMVGDAFRGLEAGGGQDQVCTFTDVWRSLVSVPGEDHVTLLSGVAGSGKTTVVTRLVQEWAGDAASQKIVLSLSFRELNLITEPQSVLELLSLHYSHLKPILPQVLLSHTALILIILDGLDEFRFPLDFDRSPKCSDPERAQGVGEMVVNLLKGHLLPGISILVTSRPHAVHKVPPQLLTQLYSVLGFSPLQQQLYFQHTCSGSSGAAAASGSPQLAAAVWGYVSSHKPLQLMCRIPAFCWIVATALREGASCLLLADITTPGDRATAPASQHNITQSNTAAAAAAAKPPAISTSNPTSTSTSNPTSTSTSTSVPSVVLMSGGPTRARAITITQIYCCFLKSVLVFHGETRQEGSHPHSLQEAPRLLQKLRPVLRDLGALAFKGLLERRFLFDQADLRSFSLDCSELSKVFLVELLREDRASLTLERSFHFIHTSLQEFLAALYYVLLALSGTDPFSGLKPDLPLVPRAALFRTLASTTNKLLRPKQLLRRYVKKAFTWGEHHQSGHMDLFCRFVSGLLVPQTRFILDGLFRKGSSSKHPSPSSSLSPPPSLPPLPPFLLPLLHSQLQSGRLSPERQVNVCHCLYEAQDPGLAQRLQGWLRVLAQEQVSDQSGPAKKDWSELAFLLQLIPDLQELHLESQGLDAEGLRRLLPVLPLFSTLRLAQNPLGPEGAAVLASALRSPDCRVERLWIVRTGLGCEGLKILAEGLKDNHTVVDLRMAINQIGDMGAACLADLLRTNHTLKDIRLRDNLITDEGVEVLIEALIENNTLEELWMFDNKFTKGGVKRLKEYSKSRSHLDIKVCV